MSWSVSITATRPADFATKVDATDKPANCPDGDWEAFKRTAKILADQHFSEAYIFATGSGHDPVAGSYPHRNISVNVGGTANP